MKKNIWVFFVNLFMYYVVKQVWDPMFYVVWQVLVIICFYSQSWEHKRRRHTFKQVWKKSKYCQCDNKSLAKSWLGWGPLGLRRSSPGRWTWRLRCGAGSCGRGGCSPWSSGSGWSTSSAAPSSRRRGQWEIWISSRSKTTINLVPRGKCSWTRAIAVGPASSAWTPFKADTCLQMNWPLTFRLGLWEERFAGEWLL